MQTIRTHLVGGSVRPGRKPDLVVSGGLDRRLAFFWHSVFKHGLVKKATLKVELDTIHVVGDIPLGVVKVSECVEIWFHPVPESDEQADEAADEPE